MFIDYNLPFSGLILVPKIISLILRQYFHTLEAQSWHLLTDTLIATELYLRSMPPKLID